MKIFVSVVVPVKKINNFIRNKLISALKQQTIQTLELIMVPDRITEKENPPQFVKVIPSWPATGPAEKRDLGVRRARGTIIAFIDDDAYPDKDWLKNAIAYFKNPKIAAVCGPGITPPNNNLRQRVSGWVWSSWLGAGGAGTYRCYPGKKRVVDDYPTFNLIVRKKDFEAVGGFDSHFWPGEDTKLCHDLVYKLGKKIIYDPKILVYHHRREVFSPHLEQISRYAIHRGHFARILPQTSFRLGYLIPTLFVLGLICGPVLIFILEIFQLYAVSVSLLVVYLFAILIYLLALLITAINVYLKEKSLRLAFLVIPSIFITHIVYGALFIKGFLSPRLRR